MILCNGYRMWCDVYAFLVVCAYVVPINRAINQPVCLVQPNRFELRKLLDAAEPPPHKSLHKSLQRLDSNNVEFSFHRTESGNLKGFKPMARSMSTEPRIQDRGGGGSGKDVSFLLDRAYSPGQRYGEEQERGGNSGGQRKRTSFVGNGSKSNDASQGTKSGSHSQMRGEVPSEAMVAERLADQVTFHVRKHHRITIQAKKYVRVLIRVRVCVFVVGTRTRIKIFSTSVLISA